MRPWVWLDRRTTIRRAWTGGAESDMGIYRVNERR